MSLSALLMITMVLLSLAWILIFFRRWLIYGLARLPSLSKVIAVILAIVLLGLALIPFVMLIRWDSAR